MPSDMSEYCASLQPKSSAENFDVKKLNIQSLIPLSYGIPTCILYIMVICILLSKKGRQEFKGSFYACFAVAGIIDLITWMYVLFFNDLCTVPLLDPVFSLIPESGIITQYVYASQIFFTIAGLINPVVLSLNRFIGIIFYLKHKQMWRRIVKVVILVYIGIPLAFTWQLFTFLQPAKKCRIQNFNNSADAYHTFNQQPPFYFVRLFDVCAYIIFVSGFVNVALNISVISVLLLRRLKAIFKPNSNKKPELKLFFIALIGCFNVLIDAVYFALIKTLPSSNPIMPAIFQSLPFILDWYFLSPVWIILILSPTLRKRLFNSILRKNNNDVTNVVSILK